MCTQLALLLVDAIKRHRRNEWSVHFCRWFFWLYFYSFLFVAHIQPWSVSSAETDLTIIYWFLCALNTVKLLCKYSNSIVRVRHDRSTHIELFPLAIRYARILPLMLVVLAWIMIKICFVDQTHIYLIVLSMTTSMSKDMAFLLVSVALTEKCWIEYCECRRKNNRLRISNIRHIFANICIRI